jgi:hypothetical protein
MSVVNGDGTSVFASQAQWNPENCSYCDKKIDEEDNKYHVGMCAECFCRLAVNSY